MANYRKRFWDFMVGNSQQRETSSLPSPIEKREISNLKNPSSWFQLMLGGGYTNAGVTVNEKTALGISAVWAAIHVLASSISSLPFKVYEKQPNGNREDASEHPVSILLRLMPKAHYTPYQFWYSIITNAVLWGASGAKIIKNEDGRPIDFQLFYGAITHFQGTNDKIYYRASNITVAMLAEDVIYIPGMLITKGMGGKGIISIFRETFGEGIAAQIFGQKFFANGAHLKGYISHPNQLGDTAFNRLKKSWKDSYEGMENVGKTAILEEGAKFEPLTVSPKDSQYTEVKKNVVEEVSRITGVPMHKLSAMERATFNNIEVMNQSFVDDTLMPWLVTIQQECNRKLFFFSEMGTHYTQFNLKGRLRGDSKSRADFYKNLFYLGAITPNEIRRLEDMNSYDGGDRYYIQQNLIPSEKVDAHFDKMNSPKMQKNGDQKS